MHAALPCLSRLSHSSACRASLAARTHSTGPKISVRTTSCSRIDSGSLSTVGPTHQPAPSATHERPSRSSCAPPATAASIIATILSRDEQSITGPTQPPCCPLRSCAALATTASISSGCSPIVISTDAAMHRWPAQPANDATMSAEAIGTSRSGAATRWFFAPPSASTFLPAARARLCTSSATRLEPTNVSAAMPAWSQSAPTTSASPCTIWKAPAGTPASKSSSAARCIVSGTFSLGLRITQLPATSAIGMVQNGT